MPDTIAERRAYQRIARAELAHDGIDVDDGQACRECGCTELLACPDGCWWVEADLCNVCATEMGANDA